MTGPAFEMLQRPEKKIIFRNIFRKAWSNVEMIDDNLLVKKILDDNTQAFTMLVKQYQHLVVHMIGRLIHDKEDREDLCQEVFLKVYQKLADFNFQSKLSTWIATIAYRTAINYLQKKKIMITGDVEDAALERKFTISPESPDSLFARKDLRQFVHQQIEKLPVQYKTVLTLYHLEGMNYEEIREVTQMPEGTVKNYLFRARKLLKEQLMTALPKEELL